MNRIQKTFKELKEKGEKALITFITAGDPNLSTTQHLVLEMEKAGADLIELGIPFSDPMADGPVIQKSSERALKGHTNLKAVLKLVKALRKNTQIPIILMGYFNPILQWGCEAFCKDAAASGVDGIIMVDLPPEESAELHRPARKNGLSLIYLLTPTSDHERIEKVKKLATGFVYYVSITGITGSSLSGPDFIAKQVKEIQKRIPLPVCIGFGIRNPKQAHEMAQIADGIVVGSTLVALLEKGGGQGVKEVIKKVKTLKKAISI